MKIAIYPGSFDPVTSGHLNIIRRAAKIFDRLIVCVMINAGKNPMFTLEERVELIRRVTADLPNVEVEGSSELLADYVIETGATVRAAATHYGISKSTVHKDLTFKLKYINKHLYLQVKEVLALNKQERHLRGGEATRKKYLNKRETEQREE